MARVLAICLAMFFALHPPAAPATPNLLLDAFDPAPLVPSERRLLQTALAAAGDYDGPLDGIWREESRQALARYAERSFASPPINLHAAALIMAFTEEVRTRGWDFRLLPGLGVSMALPFADLGPEATEEGGLRRWSLDGAFTILTHRFDESEARAWHAAAAKAGAGRETEATVREDALLVTRGILGDGRRFITRSDRLGDGWATVFLAADPGAEGDMTLAAASILPGPPLTWDLPEDGALDLLVSETEALVAESAGGDETALPQPDRSNLTGTAFYLGARTLVTAGHVVEDCSQITLADGTELALLAADPELDVAALRAPLPARRWLSLASGVRARLGERVHAAGFPYYAIAGTALHLTGGNVSALAGIDDDRRFFSFTAPVQPGNSGGPLIDGDGGVLGLVVARLSEDFIVQETGSLPQNVNYALGEGELAGFLARAGVAPSPGGLAAFDTDDGVPDGFDEAVVPIVCH
jgi:serine protease Do